MIFGRSWRRALPAPPLPSTECLSIGLPTFPTADQALSLCRRPEFWRGAKATREAQIRLADREGEAMTLDRAEHIIADLKGERTLEQRPQPMSDDERARHQVAIAALDALAAKCEASPDITLAELRAEPEFRRWLAHAG